MKSTVVIPNFNGKEYLKDCLDSLMACSPMDFDIIVVDNGSSDGSKELLLNDYPQVNTIALDTNTGFAPAVNIGIKEAKTEYVILLNNDTRVDSGFVSALEDAMDSDEKIFSAAAMMLDMYKPDILDGAGDYYCALGWAYAYGKGKSSTKKGNKVRRIFSACGGAAIYRKDLLEKIGCFDENHFAYLEDIDLGYRARIEGYKNVYVPGAIVYHAGSASSGSRYNEFKIKLSSRNSVYLILKNMPVLQLIINLPFLLLGYLVKAFFFALKGYGAVYCRGLASGISLYNSKDGKKHKVRFKLKNLKNYIIIQFELWINIFRRLIA